MASKEWTKEQRERAFDQAMDRARVIAHRDIGKEVKPFDVEKEIATDLQCELNEALELLELARPASQSIPHKAAWAKKNAEWLSRNK